MGGILIYNGLQVVDVSKETRVETERSSKGNQLKWKTEDGLWIKQDDLGYEGLSEAVASTLLEYTNILKLGFEYAEHETCYIFHKEKYTAGCLSYNFIGQEEELITLEKLIRSLTGKTTSNLTSGMDIQTSIITIVNTVIKHTKLKDFGKWLTFVLEFDKIILNEDRHYHNLGVIYRGDIDTYKLMPVFDNGLSLFSDTARDYPIHNKMKDNYSTLRSKPFSTDFEEQVKACQRLYGPQLYISIKSEDVILIMERVDGYGELERNRVQITLENSIRKFNNLTSYGENVLRDIKDINDRNDIVYTIQNEMKEIINKGVGDLDTIFKEIKEEGEYSIYILIPGLIEKEVRYVKQ